METKDKLIFHLYCAHFQYLNHFIIVNDMVDDMKHRLKLHSETVSKLISVMRSTVGECTEIGSSIDDKMEMIYEQMRAVVQQIQQNASDIKNTVEPALQATEKNVQQMKMEIVKSLDAHLVAINEQKPLFTHPKLSNDFHTKQIEFSATVTQKMVLVNDLVESVAINNTAAMDNSRKHIETIAMDLPLKRDIIEANHEIASLQSDMNESQSRLSEQLTENVTVLKEISSNTQIMFDNLMHEIYACSDQLKYFREMDFREYEPLGNLHIINVISWSFSQFKIKTEC